MSVIATVSEAEFEDVNIEAMASRSLAPLSGTSVATVQEQNYTKHASQDVNLSIYCKELRPSDGEYLSQ